MTITQELTAFLVAQESWSEVPARLQYKEGAPYEVEVGFCEAKGADPNITWILERELLRSGLDHPAGLGDIRLWPSHGDAQVLFVHLRAPGGEALFELPRHTVRLFLNKTDKAVPVGTEHRHVNITDAIEALFNKPEAEGSH